MNRTVTTRFILGPAGSGKTFLCLADVRARLRDSAEGPPLIFLAPKQATFQIERQLLADPELGGYTRLQILSFERLAEFVLAEFACPKVELLSEEGRVMVLRALLARHRDELQLFRAAHRLPGFARQLSLILREFQENKVTPERLRRLARETDRAANLKAKLNDLALLLESYLAWLVARGLKDANCLLDLAAEALRSAADRLRWSGLWLDGFAEMTAQELDLLAALIPSCEEAVLAFCLEQEPIEEEASWLSTWSVVAQTFRRCRRRMEAVPGNRVRVEVLSRDPPTPSIGEAPSHFVASVPSRFRESARLRHVERFWTRPEPFAVGSESSPDQGPDRSAVRIVRCANPEAEAHLAAREILRFVREGGRFNRSAVLVRKLEGYQDGLRRAFQRYGLPYFLDRRESVTHHPLAELTRFALRTVAFGWRQEDWFAALKTGLVDDDETAIDRTENEALARGWQGSFWQRPVQLEGHDALAQAVERLRQRWVPPFQQLGAALAGGRLPVPGAGTPGKGGSDHETIESTEALTGPRLTASLREFWSRCRVEEKLHDWSSPAPKDGSEGTWRLPAPVHSTVWEQMNGWLDNLELAFPEDRLPLREWLPILEAGLAGLTVGVIPPALDQVLIGTVDRSRNPDLDLVLLLGVNESVFPFPPATSSLLTENERLALQSAQVFLGPTTRQHLGHERYFGYIACTRARRRLILTYADFDTRQRKLNPSLFVPHLQRLLPDLEIEADHPPRDWPEAEHVSDLIGPALAQPDAIPLSVLEAGLGNLTAARSSRIDIDSRASIPSLSGSGLARQWSHLRAFSLPSGLSPEMAERLYGPELHTSVTRIEQFAACPFKFFVQSGLHAQERLRFEVDARRLGDFQHQVLQAFHEQLRSEGLRWHDLDPSDARRRITLLGETLARRFAGGLFEATERDRSTVRRLIGALEDFIETIIGWMPQYGFEPAAVELAFGPDRPLPPWILELDGGHRLVFRGIIDRVDLQVCQETGAMRCVVIDYKSSARKVDDRLLENGIQLQLPAYLNVLRRLEDPQAVFGVGQLEPVGVFYVSLRGHFSAASNRLETLADPDRDRKSAYRHAGRFDENALPYLDQREDATKGDQFSYERTKKGSLHRRYKDPVSPERFRELLDLVEARLRETGNAVFRGQAAVDPYRDGQRFACRFCDYQSICRIDPWTHLFRALKQASTARQANAEAGSE